MVGLYLWHLLGLKIQKQSQYVINSNKFTLNNFTLCCMTCDADQEWGENVKFWSLF